MTTTDVAVAVPMLSILAVATMTDLRRQQIPNVLSLGGAVVGLATQVSLFGPSGLAVGIFGWTLCLICLLPFYMTGGMAAGDVKLMATVGAFLGPVGGFAACLCTLAAGFVISLCCLGWYGSRVVAHNVRQATDPADPSVQHGQASRVTFAGKIPYAGAIALGATIVVLRPPFLMALLTMNGGLT